MGLPMEIRQAICEYALEDHLILPRPEEPKVPSTEARRMLGYLFGKISISTSNPAFHHIDDLQERFNALVHAAIYGQQWVDNVKDERTARKNLLGLPLTCKQLAVETIPLLYNNNTFDIHLLAVATGHTVILNTHLNNVDPNIYRPQPKLPDYYLDRIRSLHLSTRPINATLESLKAMDPRYLENINEVFVSCAATTHGHTPAAEVRHHIPHGRDWQSLWDKIAEKLGHVPSIKVSLCGWKVPPGWRMEVVQPIANAARGMGRVSKAGDEVDKSGDTTMTDVHEVRKPAITSKCKNQKFTVTAPWDHKQVNFHKEKKLAFDFKADEEALALFKKRADQGDNPEAGWQD